MSDIGREPPNSSPREHREAEIADALRDVADLVPVSESDGWEIASGEHDGMSLAEYVRRFNHPQEPS